MKSVAWVFGSLIGLTVAAQAADLTRPAPVAAPAMVSAYNWTGFYAGVVGGYGFGDGIRHHQWSPDAYSSDFGIRGGLIGGTIGYNYQMNDVVLGLEADYAWSGMKGSTSTPCAAPGCQTEIRSFGTVRGRVGYAIDRFLPYVTGGLAMGDVKASVGPLSGSEFKTGWTIGAGLEGVVWQNVTAKIEYLYFDLGETQYMTAPNIETNAKGSIVRAGLNYRF